MYFIVNISITEPCIVGFSLWPRIVSIKMHVTDDSTYICKAPVLIRHSFKDIILRLFHEWVISMVMNLEVVVAISTNTGS
jgi:hypothetical protein